MKMVDEKVERKYMGQSYYSDSVTIMLKGNEVVLPRILTIFMAIDLSHNKFRGEIPNVIRKLHGLREIYGSIPRGNQFETFENSSYNGNLALCGFPLSKECGDSKTSQLHPTSMLHKEDDPTFAGEFNWKVVGMGYGCGMVLGLVMGYLMVFIGKWQKKGKRSYKSGDTVEE
ncbi:receptor-like protein 9DC3 [Camellia sinensis]|uniref:receptor-like protein 9DC3 n=1 Tax=Camellia sinensis TaxID=4442 RepID=UPI001035586C|nr:receptor-like protein 9DC3 [Camellia sinensis]